MGWNGIPFYGDADLGSAIEVAKKSIAKLETNKFDKSDVSKLAIDLEKVVEVLKKSINE